jgi:hypothetical protein
MTSSVAQVAKSDFVEQISTIRFRRFLLEQDKRRGPTGNAHHQVDFRSVNKTFSFTDLLGLDFWWHCLPSRTGRSFGVPSQVYRTEPGLDVVHLPVPFSLCLSLTSTPPRSVVHLNHVIGASPSNQSFMYI